jgi:hypothetical protein
VHSVTVVFGPASLQFLFKSKERVAQFRAFRSDHPTQDLVFDDDFGQHAEIRAASIHGILIEDLDVSKLAGIEKMLHNTRIQHGAQQRANSDPAFKRAGPAVLTPMGPNGFSQ